MGLLLAQRMNGRKHGQHAPPTIEKSAYVGHKSGYPKKTRLIMCECHKKGQNSTLLKQLKGCPMTFSQSKSCILP